MGNNRNLRRCESWEGKREQEKGDPSWRLIAGGKANLISKPIMPLKQKNKDERECKGWKGGMSAGTF